jgi:signal transduction histidine kinase
MRRTSRLHWRIWLAVLASLAVFALAVGAAWKLFGERGISAQQRALAELVAAVLPPADAPRATVQDALALWRERLQSDLALHAPDGARIAATADDLPAPVPLRPDDWLASARGPALALRLPDDRVLVARRLHGRQRTPVGLVTLLVLLALAVGAGTYPVARRLTRRLERLQASVERLGGGDLAARVDARGRDEVARLAASFNESAARIERLVQSQRALLANASHELRSPLARVRMAIEMLAEGDAPRRAEIKRELERNVAELDALIDEILLASRLDATDARAAFEEVDLAALAAEECARAEARFELAATGECTLRGDARLLRRLLRNLLDNARRHGGGAEVDVVLRAATDGFELDVCDRGPGVPAAERERIFEPFYRLAGASETAGGVGLGLALVRKIAEQHGGSAMCLPRAGGGSCFRVRLPRG